MPESELGTRQTRERWLLPLFQELGYGRLRAAQAIDIDERRYPVSHLWGHSPIHLLGHRVDLDRRAPGVAGAARMSPHGMVQELLNRSDDHLWAFLSNGFRLRILRDNIALTRQAYVEFDLQAMMEGEAFSDFIVLWMLCHQSRVEAEVPETCWLEKWTVESREQGIRLLDQLRTGVENAINALGAGFLAHSANQVLRDRLYQGELNTEDYYRQVLRLVYRLLFLFVAEDRKLLLRPDASAGARGMYERFYSTRRIRFLAERKIGTRHLDLWHTLTLVMGKLGSSEGCPELGLPGLGSFLWKEEAMPDLTSVRLSNRDLLEAVRALATTIEGNVRRTVDYKNLGAEELGSVYESLLELHPKINLEARSFNLETAAGHERKTSGSYYTHDSLVHSLLDTALEPVIERALNEPDPESALLDMKICDPASGSGHFLIRAGHRVAHHLAAVRTGDEEPSPDAYQTALRDVVGKCLYGVDINPMAVELCKVSLWLEALDPGRPLSFLDHHIKCGNSLLGTTPELIEEGIPDAAYKPLTGDTKEACNWMRKINKEARDRMQMQLDLGGAAVEQPPDLLPDAISRIEDLADDTVDDVERKAEEHADLLNAPEYEVPKTLADMWCAAFVWPKVGREPGDELHTEHLRRFQANPDDIDPDRRNQVQELAEAYQLFHWHLEFPGAYGSVDNDGTVTGGFDLVLGNPPWERVKLQEKEWFATRRPDIAAAANAAARRRMIRGLQEEDPATYAAFQAALRKAEGISHLLRDSCAYPLCGRGDVNLYTVFAEGMRLRLNAEGRMGAVLPTGIATDDTTKFFFQDIIEKQSLVSLFDFENRKAIFPGVHRSYKFCLFTAGRGDQPTAEEAEFVFFAHEVSDLDVPEKRFTLSREDIALLNPNTRTCPIFRSRRDAELTKSIYRRVPVLIKEGDPDGNPWGIKFARMFDMTNDSHLFRTREQLEEEGCELDGNIFKREGSEDFLPIYEGKMVSMYDHRAATIVINPANHLRQQQSRLTSEEGHRDPWFSNEPYLWAPEQEAKRRTIAGWVDKPMIVFKRVTAVTNERTILGCVMPYTAVSYTLYVVTVSALNRKHAVGLLGNFFSFIGDYTVRQKTAQPSLPMGVVYESAFLAPSFYAETCSWNYSRPLIHWLASRVLELTYTAWDLEQFARDNAFGGPPFVWRPERRHWIRCELDAAYFHLHGIRRDDVDYIMETFPTVKRKDIRAHGTHRTKEHILEIYDRMAHAVRTSGSYEPPPESPLATVPPGPPANADGNFLPLPDWLEGAPRPEDWPPHIHSPHR